MRGPHHGAVYEGSEPRLVSDRGCGQRAVREPLRRAEEPIRHHPEDGHISGGDGRSLAVYKYGNRAGDDEHVLVGCLSPVQGRNDAIRVMHFCQINPTDRLKQSMVDARYRMEISTNQ